MLASVGEKPRVHIRWMIRRDLAEVLRIESEAFEFPWTEDDFIRRLRQRNAIGMVAEHGEQVVGFMVYELFKNHLHLLSLAVCPWCHRRGIGTAMVKKLLCKLSDQRRRRVVCEIRESNLNAQVFFRAMGFEACNTLREFYDDTDEDAYLFRYTYKAE